MVGGVLIVFLFEVMRLYLGFIFNDLLAIVMSGIVILIYLASFVRRGDLNVRKALWMIYAGSFVLWLMNFVRWLAFNKIDDIIDEVNEGVNGFLGTSNDKYADKLSDTVWTLIWVYGTIMILIKVLFIRVLYYYMKELEET